MQSILVLESIMVQISLKQLLLSRASSVSVIGKSRWSDKMSLGCDIDTYGSGIVRSNLNPTVDAGRGEVFRIAIGVVWHNFDTEVSNSSNRIFLSQL